MKASQFILLGLTAIVFAGLNTSCQKSDAASQVQAKPYENGAQFKAGEGLSLTEEMKKSIGLTVADVSEEKVSHEVTLKLTAESGNLASGWISPTEAKGLEAGMVLELKTASGTSIKGKLEKVLSSSADAMGDLEISVKSEGGLASGDALTTTIQHPAGNEVPVIPASALLKTAEGDFVYTANGKFFVRTPIKIGASDGKIIEVTDGLYSGDQIVTSSVKSLWMAELQVLRGGKACT